MRFLTVRGADSDDERTTQISAYDFELDNQPIQIVILGPPGWGKTAFLTSVQIGLSKILPIGYRCVNASINREVKKKYRKGLDSTGYNNILSFELVHGKHNRGVRALDYRGAITFSTGDPGDDYEQEELNYWVAGSDMAVILINAVEFISTDPRNPIRMDRLQDYLGNILEIYFDSKPDNRVAVVVTHIDRVDQSSADRLHGFLRGEMRNRGYNKDLVFASNNTITRGYNAPPYIFRTMLKVCGLFD